MLSLLESPARLYVGLHVFSRLCRPRLGVFVRWRRSSQTRLSRSINLQSGMTFFPLCVWVSLLLGQFLCLPSVLSQGGMGVMSIGVFVCFHKPGSSSVDAGVVLSSGSFTVWPLSDSVCGSAAWLWGMLRLRTP